MREDTEAWQLAAELELVRGSGNYRGLPEPLTRIARALRANGAEAEHRLRQYLRNRQVDGAKFKHQQPAGSAVADFICEQFRLVAELDGGQHDPESDGPRTRILEANGYTIIRFWNHDVLANSEGVVDEIRALLNIARA